jgi:hypothetical protein
MDLIGIQLHTLLTKNKRKLKMFPLTGATINDQRKYVFCISLSSIYVIYGAEEKQYGNIQIQPLLMHP